MDARHHRASRDVQVVLVPYPVAGSPKSCRTVKPARFPGGQREHWRPATRPPLNRKAKGLKQLIDSFQRQDQIVREFMQPDLALLKAIYNNGADPAQALGL